MWRPVGCYSWNEAFSDMHQWADMLLCRICGTESFGIPSPQTKVKNESTASRLIKAGFCDDYREANLTRALMATWMMSQFLDEFPPMAMDVNGTKLNLHWIFFTHKDQLELCRFDWPMSKQAEFLSLFKYAKESRFSPDDVYDRFALIDASAGTIRAKNGTNSFLMNCLGCNPETAAAFIAQAASLKGFVLFWEERPEAETLRDFFALMEASEQFSDALNHVFGPKSLSVIGIQKSGTSGGRPRKVEDARRLIAVHFPDGHAGQTYKNIAQELLRQSGVVFSQSTIVRAIRK